MNFKPILFFMLRIAIYSLMMIGILEIIKIDSLSLDFNESSYTEKFQQAFLIISSLLSFFYASKKKNLKWFFVSLGTLLLMIFIREYNNFLDNYVMNGLWESLVAIVFIIYLFFIVRNFKALLSQIIDVLPTFSFGVFFVGFLIVMIFSRIFGLDPIWENLLGDNFIRPIKRIAEEGTELLGYSLMFLAVCEMFVLENKSFEEN